MRDDLSGYLCARGAAHNDDETGTDNKARGWRWTVKENPCAGGAQKSTAEVPKTLAGDGMRTVSM